MKKTQTYYFTETTNLNSFKEASEIKAISLTSAKRQASLKQAFYNTILSISYTTDDNNFIREVVAYKKNGKWFNLI